MKREIYFDNAATTRPYEEVIRAANRMMTQYYNPSAIYGPAIEVSKQIEGVRRRILHAISAEKGNVIFTSGGTEASNSVIRSMPKSSKIVTTCYEHSATLHSVRAMEAQGCGVAIVPARDGEVRSEDILDSVDEATSLVSVMQVNNETGHIIDIERLGKEIKKKNPKTKFHVDAVQSFMKLPIDAEASQIDFLSISGHKIHGLKGCGALYARQVEKIKPILAGGGQEMGLRSGTENTVGIVALGKAVELGEREPAENGKKLQSLRERFVEKVSGIPNAQINSPMDGAAHILNISFLGVPSEILLHSLEAERIYVSSGSACSSKKKGSHVLEALGLSEEARKTAIRFSFSALNCLEEIEEAIPIIERAVRDIRKITKYKG